MHIFNYVGPSDKYEHHNPALGHTVEDSVTAGNRSNISSQKFARIQVLRTAEKPQFLQYSEPT